MRGVRCILHVLSDANLSGAPMHVLQLAASVQITGVRHVVISPEGPIQALLSERGVEVRTQSMSSKFALASLGGLRKIITEYLREGGVILHCHGARAGLFGRLAAVGTGCCVMYTEHLWTNDFHLPNKVNEWIQITALRQLSRFTTTTIAVSGAVEQFLIDRKIAKPTTIHTIYHGVPAEARISRTEGLRLGSIGSLTWQKNYRWLLEVIALVRKELPGISLVIAGDGPERPYIEQAIRQLALDDIVRLAGVVKHEELLDFYRGLDWYVQSSVNESFGIAAVEAMQAGLPVLSTPQGSGREIVGEEGCVFNPASLEKSAQGLVSRLQAGANEVLTWQQARLDRFELDKMVQAYTRLYANVGT